jgi:ABC-type amino acid transport substrate-binding protein
MKKFGFLLILIFIGLVFFYAKQEEKEKPIRIGVDPYFYSLNFKGQETWVFGFVGDLLLELGKRGGMDFERVNANWDSLLEDLGKNYEAVIGSVRPYNFLEEKYCFSPIFLPTDPVLILPVHSKVAALKEMKDLIVGVIKGSSDLLIVQKYPEIFIKEFDSLSELLNAIDRGQIDGGLGGQVAVATYLKDLYRGKLKMTEPFMEEEGLRFILLKKEKETLLPELTHLVNTLKKKKLLELQQKWNLHP